jgi:sporulation protein YlmC with PRC-barrel domain
MHHLIFSISALLGTEVVTANSMDIGKLEDVICNKDTGKITYLIISAGKHHGDDDRMYAIHHSYFYLNGDDEQLIFDQKIGKENHAFFLDLPDHYDDATVLDYSSFARNVLPMLSIAGHRSDND